MSDSAPSAPTTRPTSVGGASADTPRTEALPESDWTVAVADRIESVVGTVRDKTTVPIVKAARAVVFGSLAAVAATTALIMLVIAVVRLHVYLPFHPAGRQVWTTDAGLGAIFMAAGAFMWRKRTARKSRSGTWLIWGLVM